MGTIKRLLGLALLFLFTVVPVALAQEKGQEETVLVGRISHVEGELLRYVPDDEDWVATVKDTPVGKDDVFYAEEEVKAEFIIPNNTWIRIGDNAQIQIVKLEDDVTEVDVDSGIARFYNKSSTASLKAVTPYGQVVAPPQTTFDVYLKDESVEVSALKGRFNFVHVTDNSEYEVIAGSSSLIAGYKEVTSGEGMVNEDWNAWNVKRDALWKKRLEVKGDSSKYLPERLYYESHVLDEQGAWERVYYDGGYRYFWRPMYVSSGWGPFTHGRWTVWYGDHCWVPYEPFGYVTHHYGNWVYIDSCRRWYWAPPVRRVGIGVGPFLHIGFGWYPGRVSWIYRGGYIGWIPLAPYERYYCRRYWGPRSFVVRTRHMINERKHRHRNHAVVVKRKHFYGVDNYHKFRLRNIRGSSILNSYRGAAVINSRVIRDLKKDTNRFNFRNIEVKRKPHRSVIKKIQHRSPVGRRFIKGPERGIQARAAKITPVKRVKQASIKKPGAKGKIISAGKIKKPEKIRFKKGLRKTPGSVAKKVWPRQGVDRSGAKVVQGTKLKSFKPHTKGQGFKPSTKVKSYTPKTRVRGYTPSPKIQRYTPGTKVKSFTPKTRMRGYTPSPKIQRYTPGTKVKSFTPKTRMRGYTPSPKIQRYTPGTKVKSFTPRSSGRGTNARQIRVHKR